MAVTRPGQQTGVVPQEALGWPTIPDVTYTGVLTSRYHLDFGPSLDKGLVANYPPSLASRAAYPIFVSNVDQDGNEVAAILLPPVEAPIATTTGWALRRAEFGENEGCEANGQHIAFKSTKAERLPARDPRPPAAETHAPPARDGAALPLSLEERYAAHDGYVAAVMKAAETLEQQRFLLPADVQRYIEQAAASHVLRKGG